MSNSSPAAIPENSAVRERLLSEALRLFTASGYAATTVREIVAAAGVTKPVLYYYFGNKEGLYLEIMNGISRAFDQNIARLHQTGGSARQRLLAWFSGIFFGAHENLDSVRLAFAIYFGPPQGAPFIDLNQYFDRTLATVQILIDEGIRNGEFRPVNRDALAWALVGCHNTILEEQFCRNPPRKDHDGLLTVLNMILDGVALPATMTAAKELPQ